MGFNLRVLFLDLPTLPVRPINPYPLRLPAQFSQHIEKPLTFSEIQCLQNECRRYSKPGGQGTKEEMHYIHDIAWSVLHGELPAVNESAGRRGGDKVSG